MVEVDKNQFPFPPGFRARLHFSVSLWAEHTLVMISDQRNAGRNCASPIWLWPLKTSQAMLCSLLSVWWPDRKTQQKTLGLSGLCLRASSVKKPGSLNQPVVAILYQASLLPWCVNMTWTPEILRLFQELFHPVNSFWVCNLGHSLVSLSLDFPTCAVGTVI